MAAARIDGKDREANYGPLSYDVPHVIVTSVVYQTPKVANGALGLLTNDWQLSGNYRWMSGTPYYISYSITGITNINLTGSDQAARIVIKGDPGSGHSGNPYALFNTSAFVAPSAGSNGLESPLYYLRTPPINNLDLSVSKSIPLGGRRRVEVRLDAFNALNTVQWRRRQHHGTLREHGLVDDHQPGRRADEPDGLRSGHDPAPTRVSCSS